MTNFSRTAARGIALAVAAMAIVAGTATVGSGQQSTFRLLTFEVGNIGPRLGATRGSGEQEVVDVHNAIVYLAKANAPELRSLAPVPPDMRSLIEAGPASVQAVRTVHDAISRLKASGRFTEPGGSQRVFYPEAGISYLPPITNPSKILGFAGNYIRRRSDGTAGSFDTVDYPSFFYKSPASLTGHKTDINLEGLTTTGVHEPEFAIIIGKKATNVPVSQAMDYVLGYSIVNDVSSHDIPEGQHSMQGGSLSKSLDTFSPFGPFITLKEDVPDPHDLEIIAVVNGERHQWPVSNGNTSFLTFTVPEIIAYVSERITLLPGDVLATGVPTPSVTYAEGQVIEITVGNLGTLRNQVVSILVPGHTKFPPGGVESSGQQ